MNGMTCKEYRGKKILIRDNLFDSIIFEEIMINEEYSYIDFYDEPKVIIDAGANIGLASIYFATRYPNTKIIAIEPATDNFELLKRNVEVFPNVICENCALMKEDGWGRIINNGNTLAYQIETTAIDEKNECKCVSLDTICRKYSIDNIDLLKIDIEGSEKNIFVERPSWLEKIGAIIIELHERYATGVNAIFFSAIGDEFDHQWIGGENFYLTRADFARAKLPDIYKSENPKMNPIEQLGMEREKFDRLFTDTCALKDAELFRISEILSNRTAEFEMICDKKDAEIRRLSNLLTKKKHRFGKNKLES